MPYLVKDFMKKDVITIDAGGSAVGVSKCMSEKNVGCLVVLERAQLAGIVTERDLITRVMAQGKDPLKTKVSEFMSSPLITIDPDASVSEAAEVMAKHGIRKLPVVRRDILYGIFTARDLIKHFREYEDKITKELIRSMWSWL